MSANEVPRLKREIKGLNKRLVVKEAVIQILKGQIRDNNKILKYWIDLEECVCHSERPIGGCLKCDLERMI
jgi:hypothetical protein